MTKSIDFYFDFISPYSYLAYKRIKNICKQTCQAIGDSTPGTFRFKVLDISPTLYSKKDKSKENIIDEILFPNEKIN